MSALLANTLVNLLLPPILFLVTALIGCSLWQRHARLGRNLGLSSLALLWLASSGSVNVSMLRRPKPKS